jgi:hypothetical protein
MGMLGDFEAAVNWLSNVRIEIDSHRKKGVGCRLYTTSMNQCPQQERESASSIAAICSQGSNNSGKSSSFGSQKETSTAFGSDVHVDGSSLLDGKDIPCVTVRIYLPQQGYNKIKRYLDLEGDFQAPLGMNTRYPWALS